MTINEKKQLSDYIKGLVRESLGEMDGMPNWWNNQYGPAADLDDDSFEEGHYDDEIEDYFVDDPKPGDEAELDADPNWEPKRDWPMKGSDIKNDPIDDEEEEEDDEPAGLDELRRLAESYARESVAQILSESKKKKRKNKKEKTSSKDKTIVSQLNADGTNAAHYYYKLYGVENGTEAQKAAARSKGYKKAKGKKNDTGVPYKFSSKERNRLSSLLTDRK